MNSFSKIGRRASCFSPMLLGIGLVVALPSLGESSLNLKQALDLTLKHNAELQTYPLVFRGAEALQLQAGVKPNPILSVEVENSFGSGDYQGFHNSEINLVYSQQIELGNKQQSRINFATAETRRLQSEYQLTRLDILAETSRRYYQNILIQEQQMLIKRRITGEKRALAAIKIRAKAGAVGEADVSKMALRVARSEVQQEQLISDLKQAQIKLAAMWMSEPRFGVLSGSFNRLPALPEREIILMAVDKLPSLQYQLSLQRLSDTKLKLVQSNGQSDMTFKIGVKQHQQSSDQSLNFNFSMPLAFENPNRGRIKSAQFAIERTSIETESHKQQLKLALLEINQQLLSLKLHAESSKSKLLPLANKLLRETEKGYQKGRYSVLQWIDAQSEVFSIEQSMIGLHWQAYQQVLELERITGQPISKMVERQAGEEK